jgi:putative FmdB family regulatory protein
MPIYEYECLSCGVRFERRQSVTEPNIETCPDCGSKVRKVFHPAGIIFKGSGFYKTDYASGANSVTGDKAEKADKAEKSEKSEKSDKAEKSESGAASSQPTKTEGKSEPAKKETTKGETK